MTAFDPHPIAHVAAAIIIGDTLQAGGDTTHVSDVLQVAIATVIASIVPDPAHWRQAVELLVGDTEGFVERMRLAQSEPAGVA